MANGVIIVGIGRHLIFVNTCHLGPVKPMGTIRGTNRERAGVKDAIQAGKYHALGLEQVCLPSHESSPAAAATLVADG